MKNFNAENYLKAEVLQKEQKSSDLNIDRAISDDRDVEGFLADIDANFLLKDNVENIDRDKFFQALLVEKNVDLSIRKIVDYITKRYSVMTIGGNEIEEHLERAAFQDILKNFFDGIINSDVELNNNHFGEILKYYISTCLDDNQSILLTDTVINMLENKADGINMLSKVRMLIDMNGIKRNNTQTFGFHVEDFDKIENILFEQCDLRKFIKEDTEELQNEIGLNMRFMEYGHDLIMQNLRAGYHLQNAEFLYEYIELQRKSDKYFVRAYADTLFNFLNSAINSVEEQMWSDVIDLSQDEELSFRDTIENNEGEDITAELYNNWHNFDIHKRIEYYQIIKKYPPQLTNQEIISTYEYVTGNEYDKEQYNGKVSPGWSENLNNITVAKNVIGRYSELGSLLSVKLIDDKDVIIDKNEDLVNFFTKRVKLNSEEKHLGKALELFEENYLFFIFSNLNMRRLIEKQFNIKLEDTDIFTQKQFFHFLSSLKTENIEKIKKFFDRDNESGKQNRIKVFLSLEQDGKMGEKILLIGEKLDGEDADLIFEKYAKIVDLTEDVRRELEKMFEGKEVSDEEVRMVSEGVLIKASSLLADFADKIENLKKGKKVDKDEILRELEYFNEDLLFTFSVFKGVEGAKFEDLKGVSFERVSVDRYANIKDKILAISRGEYEPRDNDNEEIKEVYQMFKLYRKNYKGREKLLKKLLEGFAKILTEGIDTNLYFVKKDNKIVAFNRCDKISDDKKYFGSCNVMPSVQAMSIGGALFNESIRQESPEYDIEMATDAFSPISSLYIEKGNFQVEEITDRFDPDGVLSFVLERKKDEERKSFYENKDMIEEYKKQSNKANQVEEVSHFVLKFDDAKEQQNFIAELVNKKGFKITRNFLDKKMKEMYLGLEKNN